MIQRSQGVNAIVKLYFPTIKLLDFEVINGYTKKKSKLFQNLVKFTMCTRRKPVIHILNLNEAASNNKFLALQFGNHRSIISSPTP
jgi:hypothetical protein